MAEFFSPPHIPSEGGLLCPCAARARVCGEVERASMRGGEGCGGFYRTAHPVAQHMRRASLLKDRLEVSESLASDFFGASFQPTCSFGTCKDCHALECGNWQLWGICMAEVAGTLRNALPSSPNPPWGNLRAVPLPVAGGLRICRRHFCPASGARQRRLRIKAFPSALLRLVLLLAENSSPLCGLRRALCVREYFGVRGVAEDVGRGQGYAPAFHFPEGFPEYFGLPGADDGDENFVRV